MPNTSEPASRGQDGLREGVSLSRRERSQIKPEDLRSQAFATGREHEQEARRRALQAVGLCGIDAFTHAALATHHARQAVALMTGAGANG
jgi:hypothetical protein